MSVNYKTEYYEKVKPNYQSFDDGIKEYWAMVYSDRWQILSDIANKEFFEPRKVLEIGCGMGRALSWFKEFGADVTGIEPSDYACQIARQRGIMVINGYFDEREIDEQFDVIYIEQVLSHIPDFLHTLIKAKKLLKDDGLIMIEEPNDNNQLQKLLEAKHGRYWVTPDHCNYFNFGSLTASLQDIGFEVVEKMATYPMEFFELMGKPYIGNERQGQEVHKLRHELESRLPDRLRMELQRSWAKLGIGRDIILVGKKGVSL